MQANAVLAWNYFNDKAAGRKPRGFKVMLLGWFPKTLYSFLAGATLLLTSFPRNPLLSGPLLQERSVCRRALLLNPDTSDEARGCPPP